MTLFKIMNDRNSPGIRRALLSVSDKTGIVEIATSLHKLGIDIISTGGTAKLLKSHNIPLIEVSEYTGFPEIMDGRVKTLHPKIYGGILARAGIDDEILTQHQIDWIDLVIVNLYPFQQTIADPACSFNDALANIDVGGPAMIRASAKNHQRVTVVVDPQDYPLIIQQLEQSKNIELAHRLLLATKAFTHTSQYDAAIANYFENVSKPKPAIDFPEIYSCHYYKKQTLRYGENPHQQAALYIDKTPASGTVAVAKQLQGKELSFNNIADTDAALACVKEFEQQHACVIVKHANPCGVAVRDNQLAAYHHAFITDPTSSFGGIIAFNQELQPATAAAIINNQFVEVIIAPKIASESRIMLATKPNIRVLESGHWDQTNPTDYDYKKISGGLLIQSQDHFKITATDLKTVTNRHPTAQQIQDLLFAWQVVKHVKSNAIVYIKNHATIGIGAGQMSRVASAHIAGLKATEAGFTINEAVMASDAFFPFRDGIDAAAALGISAIIQPGGSIRDDEVIQAANEANIAMVFTGIRHFRH